MDTETLPHRKHGRGSTTTNLYTPYNHRPPSYLSPLAHVATEQTLDERPGEASSRRGRHVQWLAPVLGLGCLSLDSDLG